MAEQWFPNGMLHYLLGGLLIGAGVSVSFLLAGLVTGMSTVFTATWSYCSRLRHFHQERFLSSRRWRLALAAGLIIGGMIYVLTLGRGSYEVTSVSWWQLLIGGFLVGYGARLGEGCTSGHGICGLASFQLPSFLSVLTFLVTAIATAHLMRALGGV